MVDSFQTGQRVLSFLIGEGALNDGSRSIVITGTFWSASSNWVQALFCHRLRCWVFVCVEYILRFLMKVGTCLLAFMRHISLHVIDDKRREYVYVYVLNSFNLHRVKSQKCQPGEWKEWELGRQGVSCGWEPGTERELLLIPKKKRKYHWTRNVYPALLRVFFPPRRYFRCLFFLYSFFSPTEPSEEIEIGI